MGQTSSSGQVDYTFGLVTNNSDNTYPPTADKEERNIQERLLRYPQQYGLENDSFTIGYDSDDEFGVKRLSTPSTSSACSIPLHSPFYFRTSLIQNEDEQNDKHTIDRIDSGYADQDVFFGPKKESSTINSRLAQDIRYVDQLYYATKKYHQEFNSFDSLTSDYDDDDTTIGTKMTFAAAALASQDPTMRDICLSRRSLIYLDPNIGLLTSLRKLDLSHNMLTKLPDCIGQLKQLEVLTISKNDIRRLPDSIQYLPRLIELDVSHNQLDCLPPLSHLTSLSTLLLSHNRLTRLPWDLTGMKRLVTMDLTNNPLSVLPAEITRLSNLRRLRLDHCQKLLSTDEHQQMEMNLAHDPPSLLEICARKVLVSIPSVKTRHSGAASLLTKLGRLSGPLLSYLASANICSSCHGPYFESYVTRRRLIERNDLQIPLEYTLCSAHWSDETDRLLNMFHSETSFLCGDGSNAMVNTIASLHALVEQQQQQQQQQQPLSPSASLCMEMDEIDSKLTEKTVPFLWRHPQRLQPVRNNKYPSSFLISKINRG